MHKLHNYLCIQVTNCRRENKYMATVFDHIISSHIHTAFSINIFLTNEISNENLIKSLSSGCKYYDENESMLSFTCV